jgi:tol-pal system protein YbgF
LNTKWVVLTVMAVFLGAVGGSMLTPQPAGAVNKDMIQLQEQVSQLLQGQQDIHSAIDANSAAIKTLVQQQVDSVNHLATQMSSLQSALQEVQANGGSKIDTITQQTQGLSDNLQDVQARVGKLAQQLTDMQNLLQSIDSKVSNGSPAPGATPGGASPGTMNNGGSSPAPGTPHSAGNSPNAAMPPISADTLYQNGLRDYQTGNYDLAHQEFTDYIRNFPSNDLASNAQFYLGEILYAQGDYKNAVNAYDAVLANYPHSFKLPDSLLKKAMAEQDLSMRTAAIRDYRDVIRRYPGSDASRRASARLRDMGASTTAQRSR